MGVTHINEKAAQKMRDELIEKLELEGRDDLYLDFMRLLERLAPHLMSDSGGAPSAATTAASFVGALGFSSFAEMRRTKKESGGLELNDSKWENFKKAYKIICQHPVLEKLGLGAWPLVKKVEGFGDDIPTNEQELKAKDEELKQKKEEEKQRSQKQIVDENNDLRLEVVKLNAKLEAHQQSSHDLTQIIESVSKLKDENAALSAQHQELQNRNNELEHEARVSKTRYEELKNRLSSMTLWQRIKADFNIL